ncbi:MAG: ATP-binding protein [Acidobacteriota bacterium]
MKSSGSTPAKGRGGRNPAGTGDILVIVFAYASLASLWILTSDWLLAIVVSDHDWLVALSNLKGYFFVGVTSLFLYWLLHRGSHAPRPSPAAEAGRRSGLVAWPRWTLYATAFVLAIVTIVVRQQIAVSFANRPLLIMMVMPIIIAATLGGFGPGLFATVLTAGASARFMPPDGRFAIALTHDLVQWGILIANGLLISLVSEVLHRSWRREATRSHQLEAAQEELRGLYAELEQRVAERTAQLEAANRELEAFSYSVSHDLRAPLRAIDGFTRVLLEDYGTHLDAAGRRICSVISSSARDMGRLIDDLLSFSRVGRAAMAPSTIDMTAMARSIFFEVTTPEMRERIDFTVNPLPPAVGDPSLMRQVWTNLIGNAAKFSSKRDRAVITIRAWNQDGEIVYAVQDNGAGFDKRYVKKLFGVFQRLHSTTEFEGSGVGLAIVQRIVLRHGGRVWADGDIGEGATFCFSMKGE